MEDAVAAATVGAALLHPLAVRNQPAAPDSLVVLAAPPGEKLWTGTEAAQDTGAPILTAATTLLRTCCEPDERQHCTGVMVLTVPGAHLREMAKKLLLLGQSSRGAAGPQQQSRAKRSRCRGSSRRSGEVQTFI